VENAIVVICFPNGGYNQFEHCLQCSIYVIMCHFASKKVDKCKIMKSAEIMNNEIVASLQIQKYVTGT
jgi:hypothetical protein